MAISYSLLSRTNLPEVYNNWPYLPHRTKGHSTTHRNWYCTVPPPRMWHCRIFRNLSKVDDRVQWDRSNVCRIWNRQIWIDIVSFLEDDVLVDGVVSRLSFFWSVFLCPVVYRVFHDDEAPAPDPRVSPKHYQFSPPSFVTPYTSPSSLDSISTRHISNCYPTKAGAIRWIDEDARYGTVNCSSTVAWI